LKLPILRGVVALVESLTIGIGALTYSANQVADEEEQLSPREMALSVVVALALGAGLFIVLPTVLVRFLVPQAAQGTRVIYLNLLEGALRIGIFLLYITGISLLKDIQRFFAYHGAEHKVIHAYEAGRPLTMEEIRPMSPCIPAAGPLFSSTSWWSAFWSFLFWAGRILRCGYWPAWPFCPWWLAWPMSSFAWEGGCSPPS